MRMAERIATQTVFLTGLFILGGCTSVDDAGLIITNSELFACADADDGAVEDGAGQMRAEVVAEVYEHAGGASQQELIVMEQLWRRGSNVRYAGSKQLSVPRDCVTRLSGDFLFEANAGDPPGVISETRHVATDVSRLIVISVQPTGDLEFGNPLDVVVSLPCPLRVPAVAYLRSRTRLNSGGSGDPTTFSATLDSPRLEFAPGVTRQSTTLWVEAVDPGDDFGVIATVIGMLEVSGNTVDSGCSASCVGNYCTTCEQQYRDCAEIGRAYCGISPTSCEDWPDGI